MSRRWRISLWVLALLLLVTIALTLLVGIAWQDWRRDNHIERLQWQGLDWSLEQLTVREVEVVQARPEHDLQVQLRGLVLDWDWTWQGLRLQKVELEHVSFNLQPRPGSVPETPSSAPANPLQGVPDWLPDSIAVESFRLQLPCATGSCVLEGGVALELGGDDLLPLQVQGLLVHGDHRLTLQGSAGGSVSSGVDLKGDLAIDGERQLTVSSTYIVDPERQLKLWSGEIALPALPQTDWLLEWLRQWQPIPSNPLPSNPRAGAFAARWQLQAPSEPAQPVLTAGDLQQATGNLRLNASLAQPWPIPGVGTARGDLELALRADQGQWMAENVTADLHLSDPGAWVQALPGVLRPKTLALNIKPAPGAAQAPNGQRLLPLKLSLNTTGATPISLESQLALATAAPWHGRLGRVLIKAALPPIAPGGWRLKGTRVDLALKGELDRDSLSLQLVEGSKVEVEHLDEPGPEAVFWIDRLQASLAGVTLAAQYTMDRGNPSLTEMTLSGPVEISAQRLRHPALRQQSWNFSGNLSGNLDRVGVTGRLGAETGMTAEVSLDKALPGPLALSASTALEGADVAGSLAAILVAWPALLSTDAGGVSANVDMRLPVEGAPVIAGELVFDAVGGTYDRTAWSGLTGNLDVVLEPGLLRVAAPDLEAQAVNPGIPVGPITLGASYRASPGQILQGRLDLDKARAAILGGHVQVEPGVWDLSTLPLQVPVHLENINLTELMAAYPAEGLAGSGSLSGKLPLIFSEEGVTLGKGTVAAAPPGGVLKLPLEQIGSIANDNPALKLVAEAMDNFHYSVLNSEVEYDQEGTLLLGLHLQGKNPNFQQGQPIHFNIKLEEDIPALLTSLQLSGRVSDAVTDRVKKMIRNGDARGSEAP